MAESISRLPLHDECVTQCNTDKCQWERSLSFTCQLKVQGSYGDSVITESLLSSDLQNVFKLNL